MLLAERRSDLDEVDEIGFTEKATGRQHQQPDDEVHLPEQFYQEFVQDTRDLATKYMATFFEGKDLYCGGPISPKMLVCPDYLTLVLNTDITNGVLRAYEILDREGFGSTGEEDEQLASEDVRLVLAVLRECGKLKIPKDFRGGLLLIYLEICEGFSIKDYPQV